MWASIRCFTLHSKIGNDQCKPKRCVPMLLQYARLDIPRTRIIFRIPRLPRASTWDVMLAERGAAPARGIRNLASGTPWVAVRPYYEGLPSMAGLGRAKEAKASGSGPRRVARPCAGSTAPRRKAAASGAPRGGCTDRKVHARLTSARRFGAPRGAPRPHFVRDLEIWAHHSRGYPRLAELDSQIG